MSLCLCTMQLSPIPRYAHARLHAAALAASTDGPVADTAEPVTPQPVVSGADSDGDDGHTMSHE